MFTWVRKKSIKRKQSMRQKREAQNSDSDVAKIIQECMEKRMDSLNVNIEAVIKDKIEKVMDEMLVEKMKIALQSLSSSNNVTHTDGGQRKLVLKSNAGQVRNSGYSSEDDGNEMFYSSFNLSEETNGHGESNGHVKGIQNGHLDDSMPPPPKPKRLEEEKMQKAITVKSPFSLDTVTLSDEAKDIARNELRETPDVVEFALEELRAILKADTSIYFGDLEDDDFLKIFLRPCKYYAESAHQLMIRISDFKLKHHKLLDNLLPCDEKDTLQNNNVVNVFKDKDHLGRRVLLVSLGEGWSPKAVSTNQLFRMFYLIHEAAVLEPETQVRGVVVIMDFNGMSIFKQGWALTTSGFHNLLIPFIQDAMPLRLKEVHIVNEPMGFSKIWKLFEALVNAKLKKRIIFHGSNRDSLHKYMLKSHLPADYGGDLPKIDYKGFDWYPAIDSHTAHIKRMNTYGYTK